MYNNINQVLQAQFAQKIAKLSLDGGFSCPNRENGKTGCAFCGAAGAGEFAGDRRRTIAQQLAAEKARMRKKWPSSGFIAYFQAFTNTYAPVTVLEEKYRQALADPEVLGLAIATRPDCLPLDVLDLLERLSRETYLWVELGFQTANETTAAALHRGYENQVFTEAVNALNHRGIRTVAHVILGLPGETRDDWLATVAFLNALPLWGVKLHLFYVTADAALAVPYQEGKIALLSRDAAIQAVCDCLTHLRPDITVHRLTGDPPRHSLLAPAWSLQKWSLLNDISLFMEMHELYQGKYCDKSPIL